MSDKMPIELEDRFIESLLGLQSAHKAYWIQTRHIARALFGNVLNDEEDERDRMRVYRLGQRLLERNLIKKTERIEKRGNLNVKIVYFHTDAVLEWVKQQTAEKRELTKKRNETSIEELRSWSIPAYDYMKKKIKGDEYGGEK